MPTTRPAGRTGEKGEVPSARHERLTYGELGEHERRVDHDGIVEHSWRAENVAHATGVSTREERRLRRPYGPSEVDRGPIPTRRGDLDV